MAIIKHLVKAIEPIYLNTLRNAISNTNITNTRNFRVSLLQLWGDQQWKIDGKGEQNEILFLMS